jgi:hypothetical protein
MTTINSLSAHAGTLALTDVVEGEVPGSSSFKMTLAELRTLLQASMAGVGANTTVVGNAYTIANGATGASVISVGGNILCDHATGYSQHIGWDLVNTGRFNTLIGSSIKVSDSGGVDGPDFGVYIGRNVNLGIDNPSGYDKQILIGAEPKASSQQIIVIGDMDASATNYIGHVYIGNSIRNTHTGVGGDCSVVIGYDIDAFGGRNVIIGGESLAEAVSVTQVGYATRASNAHSIVLGRTAEDPPTAIGAGSYNFTLGGVSTDSQANHIWVGNGWGHRYTDQLASTNNFNPTTIDTFLHGYDAYDAVDGSTVDIGGGDLILAAGRSTGSGVAGSVLLQTGDGVDLTGNVKQALETVIEAAEGNKIGLYGTTAVAQAAALTAADAATVDGTYGAEEAGVINNLRTRLGEVETALANIGLTA